MLDGIRFVFLDRDGVISAKAPKDSYIRNCDEFRLIPKAAEAIAQLNSRGIKVVVITNQRGIALGLFSESDLQQIHNKLAEDLARFGAHVDAIFYCPHAKNACNCRKPKPGLFFQAFERFPEATPNVSIMMGDSLSDIEAAHALGMRTVLIRNNGHPASKESIEAENLADAVADSLGAAVKDLLSEVR